MINITKEDLRDAIIDLRELTNILERYWNKLSPEEVEEATEIRHLPCDGCEEEEDAT